MQHKPELALGLALWDTHSMRTLVCRDRRRFPPALSQEGLVFEPKDFHLERATALDHLLLAIGAEAPQGEISAGAGTCGNLIVSSTRMKEKGRKG